MDIKTKLRFAFGLLFLIVFSFGGISLYYMKKIGQSSKNILKDNYESLNYSGKMRKILDDNSLPFSKKMVNQFSVELKKEQSNVTEVGERKAVMELSDAFKIITDPATDITVKQKALNKARIQIRIIEELNMNAVVRKNTEAQQEGQKAANYLILATSICFMLLFSLAVNLPDMLTKANK